MGRNQLLNQSQYPDEVNAYKTLILKTAVLLGAKNNSQTHQQIDEIVDFEAQLANVNIELIKVIWFYLNKYRF